MLRQRALERNGKRPRLGLMEWLSQ
uniref:Uncharacterized protein n=1 Tax=Anguilla anguilla TaxID=7936 RepID=A0A0E9TAY2_ANGAN